MPLRFFRRLRIAKGLTLNLSKRGASLSAGRRGAHLTFGRRGTRATAGAPGTGVSYTSRLGCLLPAALVLAALLAACAPAGDGPIAGEARAVSTGAPASAATNVSASAPVASVAAPTQPIAVPSAIQPVTLPPVPPAATIPPAPLPTVRPPTLAPPTLAPAPLPPTTGVRFTFVKSPVAPNGTGQVTVATAPNATCTIVVTYLSGPSRAQGLIPQVASASGMASWTWNIGTSTTAGTWPIVVTCGSATARTTFVVQ